MSRKALIVTPRLAIQKGDFLGSGVPYWPLEAVTFAALLRESGWTVQLLDLFGLAPNQLEEGNGLYWQGLPLQEALKHPGTEPLSNYSTIFVYALSAMSHQEVLNILHALKTQGAHPLVVFENSQAVTGYDILKTAEEFRKAGADFLLAGEPYGNWKELNTFFNDTHTAAPANILALADPGASAQRQYVDPIHTPVPAWDLVPMKNYWKLPYSHGPKRGPYLPVLTSRGCPYPCTFCVVPSTNDKKWRARTADEVVEEMSLLNQRFGVKEFHWEDLDPTIDKIRMQKISALLSAQGTPFRYRLVSGTKVETLDVPTLEAMAQGGCDYISISPESGSPEILKKMHKPFNHAQALEMVRAMRARGIHSQACFVLGHPEETTADREMTEAYVKKIVQAGISEAAFFILSPLPGSGLYSEIKVTDDAAPLWSFSPRHRPEYAELERWRKRLVKKFLLWKLRYHPVELLGQSFNALLGRPTSKMEMLPRRVAFVSWALFKR